MPDVLTFLNDPLREDFPEFSGFMPAAGNTKLSATVSGSEVNIFKEEIRDLGCTDALLDCAREKIVEAMVKSRLDKAGA